MRRFLIIAVALIACVGCHNFDKKVDGEPNGVIETELEVDKSELHLDYTAQSVDIVVRPEDVDVVPYGEGTISGVITSNTFKGVHFEISVASYGMTWLIHSTQYIM